MIKKEESVMDKIYTEADLDRLVRQRLAEHNEKLKKQRRSDNSNMLGWRRKVPMWLWNSIVSDGCLGWQVDKDNNPAWIKLEHIRGKELQSSGIASTFDNEATGLFYYRDWTDSGIQVCRNGKTYWSGWWFQFIEDYETFTKKYKELIIETNRG